MPGKTPLVKQNSINAFSGSGSDNYYIQSFHTRQ